MYSRVQNASKCTILKEKMPFFGRRGREHSPLPDPPILVHWGGG